jgi:ABC-type bacteriocin/lantibiotic exporter with double-glycine peptidase domain
METEKITAVRLIWSLALRFRRSLGVLFAFAMLNALLKLPVPFLTRYTIDRVIPSRSMSALGYVICLIILMSGIYLLSDYGRSLFSARISRSISAALQIGMLKHVLSLPVSYFSQCGTGYIMSRFLDDASQIKNLLTDTCLGLLQNSLVILCGIGAVFYINWKLALISILTLPPFVYASVRSSDNLRRWSKNAQEERAKVSQTLHETMEGIATIKIYVRERWRLLVDIRALRQSILADLKTVVIGSKSTLVISAFASLGSLMVVCFGSIEIMHGKLTVGGLLAFSSVLGYLYGPSQMVAGGVISMQRALASMQRVVEVLSLPPEITLPARTGISPVSLASPVHICFDRVSFAYNSNEYVLKDITFSVTQPAVIAIAGHSGAGKSTILALLLQLYRPTTGQILLNGTDMTSLDARAIRRNVGYVDQNAFLFNASVGDNIKVGRDISDEAMVEAAVCANAAEFVEQLPDRYRTIVGAKG